MVKAIVLAVLCSTAGSFFGNFLLSHLTKTLLIPLITDTAKHADLKVSSADFGSAQLLSASSFQWQSITAVLRSTRPLGPLSGLSIEARLGALAVTLESMMPPRIRLEMKDAEFFFHRSAPPKLFDRQSASRMLLQETTVKLAAFKMPISAWTLFQFSFRRSGLKSAILEFFNGEAPEAVEAEGELRCLIGGKPVTLRFGMKMDAEGRQKLVLDRDGLRRLSPLYSEKLTDAEIAVISNYPLRSPALLRLKELAEMTAYRAKKSNLRIPEDAYRHIYWSYQLTNLYGEQFAKLVTDAHEGAGASDDDDDASHTMDLQNNAIGRSYAKQGIKEDALLRTLLFDKKVVLRPANSLPERDSFSAEQLAPLDISPQPVGPSPMR